MILGELDIDTISAIHHLLDKYGTVLEIKKILPWYLLSIKVNDGWLVIDDNDGHYFITWSTYPQSHNVLARPLYGVNICKETGALRSKHGLTGAWKTAISIWPISDKKEAQEVFSMMLRLINRCYTASLKEESGFSA